ncbi:MAG: Clp protease N-terminal domain-containing protein [Streptosporangiaceae bacterium]|jgi:hypothetical protein
MFERFTLGARGVLVQAQHEARMLLVRDEKGVAARVLGMLGGDLNEIRWQVIRLLGGPAGEHLRRPFHPRAAG